MKTQLSIVLFIFSMIFANAAGFAEDSPGLADYLGNPQYPDDFWQVSSPEKEGMDGDRLRESLDFIKGINLKFHSFLVIKNGKLVFDQYSDSLLITPDSLHPLWSTTKTFTSALIGIAIAEGKIPGVKTRVMNYFEHDKIDNLDKDKQMITIENLLTMESGLDFDDDSDLNLFFSGPSNASLTVLNKPMSFTPGSIWSYNSGNSQVLAEIIRRATGKTPLEYAEEKIFNKIGIKILTWGSDESGTQYGGIGLSLRPRDLARFGYLYLNKGKWGDVSVIPEEWINESTKVHIKTWWPEGGYGYHCWIPNIGGFATRGRWGQMMYVFPDKDLIVVFTADIPAERASGIEDAIVYNYILPACR